MSDDPHKDRIEKLRQRLMQTGSIQEPQAVSPRGSAHERRKVERHQRSVRVSRQALRRTGRTELFPFRCNPELIEQVKASAKKRGMPIAAWMEGAIEAELAKEGEENA